MRAPINLTNRSTLQKGFTIIEVMIVLAVAAMIMLIVFLAVPALQRNAANTQRTADATKVASGVNECLSNRNDIVTSCDSAAEVVGVTLDTATLQKLTTVNFPGGAIGFPSGNATASIYFGYTCNADGSSYTAGNSQQFVVLFNAQSSTNGSLARCIGG